MVTVDEIAQAIADARLWPGAWATTMCDAERDSVRQGAEGVHRLLELRSETHTTNRNGILICKQAEPGQRYCPRCLMAFERGLANGDIEVSKQVQRRIERDQDQVVVRIGFAL